MNSRVASCACSAGPALYTGADISGKWSGIAGVPVWVTFQQDGEKLRGTAGQSPSDRSLSFEDGKVDGNQLTFKAGAFLFDLRIGDGEITGEVNMGGGESAKVVLHRLVENSGPAPRRAFEVASVKRMPSPMGGYHSSIKLDPGRLTCNNVNLRQLIVYAFAVKDYQVYGPDWMSSEVYDISATLPAGAILVIRVMPMTCRQCWLNVSEWSFTAGSQGTSGFPGVESWPKAEAS